jgi:hypothetical protein
MCSKNFLILHVHCTISISELLLSHLNNNVWFNAMFACFYYYYDNDYYY